MYMYICFVWLHEMYASNLALNEQFVNKVYDLRWGLKNL